MIVMNIIIVSNNLIKMMINHHDNNVDYYNNNDFFSLKQIQQYIHANRTHIQKQGITWHLNDIHMTIQLLWIYICIYVCVFIQDQVTTGSGAATQLSGLAMNW